MRFTLTIAILALLLSVFAHAGAPLASPRANNSAQHQLLSPNSKLKTQNSKLKTQNSKLTVSVRAGYGDTGAYIIGEWIPVWVTLTNPPGGEAMRVRVEIDSVGTAPGAVYSTYALDVEMPGNARKISTLYAYTTGYVRDLEVRVLDEGNAIVERATARIEPLEAGNNVIVGVLSSDPSLLNALNGEAVGHTTMVDGGPYASQGQTAPSPARAHVAHLTSGDLPELSQALDSLGVLALDDLTLSITPEGARALEAWVMRGGMLVKLGRPSGGGVPPEVAEMLPVTLGPPQRVGSLSSLGTLVAIPPPEGEAVAPGATLRQGAAVEARALALDGEMVLAAIRELGGGLVTYLALSPALPPLNAWAGTVPLVKRLLAEHAVQAHSNAARRLGTNGYMSYLGYGGGLFSMPGLELPSPLLIALFLIGYIAIVGPVNFMVLRRMGRQELAWATIPALVVVFSVGAYLVGYGTKGGEVVAVRADMVVSSQGSRTASVTRLIGIFSPARGTYKLELTGNGAVSELNSYGYGETSDAPHSALHTPNSALVEGVTITSWSLRGFAAEGVTEEESPLEVELRLAADVFEGAIRNRSAAVLEDVALLMGGGTQYVGRLEPGEEKGVLLAVSRQVLGESTLTQLLPPPGGMVQSPVYGGGRESESEEIRLHSRKSEVLRWALADVAKYEPPTSMAVAAFGWTGGAGDELRVAGDSRQEGVTLWASRATVNTAHATPLLSSGLVPYSIYTPGSASPLQTFRTPQSALNTPMMLAPYADITLRLPPGTAPSSIRFSYYAGAMEGTVGLLAYNPRTGAWTPVGQLEKSSAAQNNVLEVPDPARFTGPAGDMTLRLLADSNEKTLTFSTLEFGLNLPAP